MGWQGSCCSQGIWWGTEKASSRWAGRVGEEVSSRGGRRVLAKQWQTRGSCTGWVSGMRRNMASGRWGFSPWVGECGGIWRGERGPNRGWAEGGRGRIGS